MESSVKQLATEVRGITQEIGPEIIELRRTFHQYPELSWKEFKTGQRIQQLFRDLHLEVRGEICGTGVVAEFPGRERRKTIALRADMDALPMHDVKDVPYASKVPGVMHACGHDTHMAMAVGVARVLKKLNLSLPGSIRFIFQPSEEAAPSGAQQLVKHNVMEGVDRILAFHVDPTIEVGKIGLRAGVLTAFCDEFVLTVLGRSGHAARPHHAVDSIYLATQILNALYEIVPNLSEKYWPAVLSIGKIEGGTKANVLPEKVRLFGTIRTLDEHIRTEILSEIENRVLEITRAAGASFELDFPGPVPSVNNNPETIALVREAATLVNSGDGIVDIEHVSMGGEDFSWYLTKAPGALIRLGARKPGAEIYHLHTHNFDIDEQALAVGINVMTTAILKYLFEENSN